MKKVVLVSCVVLALIAGFAAGFKTALAREHNRLERNKALARIAEEKVSSGRNSDDAIKVARGIFANDYVSHDWTGDSTGGLAGFEKGIAANRLDYSDWTEKVESMVAEGDLVAVRILSSGTQARDLAAVPHISPAIPNKHLFVRFPEIEIFRVSNGKLAEQWDISDGWDANAQAGLFDPDHWPESVCETAQKR